MVTDISQEGGGPDPDNNGDPGDNDQPTRLVLTISPLDIPTIGEPSMFVLMGMLAWTALRKLRRRDVASL